MKESKELEDRKRRLAEQWRREGQVRGWLAGRDEGLSEGRIGQAGLLLRLLASRGIPVSPHEQHRILACTDTLTLDRWWERAHTATTLQQVLGGK